MVIWPLRHENLNYVRAICGNRSVPELGGNSSSFLILEILLFSLRANGHGGLGMAGLA